VPDLDVLPINPRSSLRFHIVLLDAGVRVVAFFRSTPGVPSFPTAAGGIGSRTTFRSTPGVPFVPHTLTTPRGRVYESPSDQPPEFPSHCVRSRAPLHRQSSDQPPKFTSFPLDCGGPRYSSSPRPSDQPPKFTSFPPRERLEEISQLQLPINPRSSVVPTPSITGRRSIVAWRSPSDQPPEFPRSHRGPPRSSLRSHLLKLLTNILATFALPINPRSSLRSHTQDGGGCPRLASDQPPEFLRSHRRVQRRHLRRQSHLPINPRSSFVHHRAHHEFKCSSWSFRSTPGVPSFPPGRTS